MEQSRALIAARQAEGQPHARLQEALVRAGSAEAWSRQQELPRGGRPHRDPVGCVGFGEALCGV